jgi:formylglycine-generating enzyme required for sulfatase activity
MASEVRHLKVFVASPGDVAEERRRLPAVIERVNKRVRRLGYALDLWRWEADALPGIGDVQALINPELDAADIVVLLVWTRLGTPTPRAPSGTVEEVQRAIERRHRVLPYHCRRPVDPMAVDLDQLVRVRDFVQWLNERALLKSYTEADELASLVEDHLVEVVERIAAPVEEARPAVDPWSAYLAYVAREHAYIPLQGFASADLRSLALDRVFVRLSMWAPRTGLERDGGFDTGRADLPDLLRATRWALVGDPGAGKTTVLRYVALRLAKYHLGRDPDAGRELGFEGTPPHPLYLRLPDVADKLRQRPGPPRAAVSQADWIAALDGLGCPTTLDGVLVLFDGLDEVRDGADRRWLAASIRELANRFAGPDERPNRFGVACRTRAWGEGAELHDFADARLLPLDAEQVGDFVGKWFSAVPHDADALREGLRATIRANEAVRRIATNPQLLTMLCLLYVAQRSLPEARALLYTEVINQRLRRPGRGLERWGGEEKVRRLLRRLAWHMHADDPARAPRDTLSVEDAARLLAPDATGGDVEAALGDLLHDLEVHAGLLTTEGANLRFLHRTFQEFLVAEHLAGLDEPAAAMGERAYESGWAEVVGLTAALIARRNEDKLRAYLAALAGGGGELPVRAARVATAAICLTDLEAFHLPDTVIEPVTAGLAEVLPVLTDPQQRTPAAVRIAVADGLGRIRDPRLNDRDRWVDMPAGTFWRGAAPDDSDAEDNEKPAGHVELWAFRIHRWPVTVEEFAPFVELGYQEEEWWSPEGWAWRTRRRITAPAGWESQQSGRNHPVVGLSWYEACAWCRWTDSTSRGDHRARGWEIRLPTEAEWERAVRGLIDEGVPRLYGWGEFGPSWHGNIGRAYGDTTPVGVFPAGHNAQGLWDCTGNVWEWCNDLGLEYRQPEVPNPFVNFDGRSSRRTLRGGAWTSLPSRCRVSYRLGHRAQLRLGVFGFRPVAAPPLERRSH